MAPYKYVFLGLVPSHYLQSQITLKYEVKILNFFQGKYFKKFRDLPWEKYLFVHWIYKTHQTCRKILPWCDNIENVASLEKGWTNLM